MCVEKTMLKNKFLATKNSSAMYEKYSRVNYLFLYNISIWNVLIRDIFLLKNIRDILIP